MFLNKIRKFEKTTPWVIISILCLTFVFGTTLFLKEVIADTFIRSVTVGNEAPSIGTVILDGGSDITLTENATATVQATATVTDVDGYSDVSSITGKIFRSGVGTSCSANDNNCYSDSACATSSCSENACTATCEYEVWFHADPTDAGTYSAEYWEAYIKVTDTDNASTSATSTGVEMNTLRALDLSTSSITYGSLNPGSTTGAVNPTNTTTATGNEAIDIYLYGTDMESGANSISVGWQSYATSSFNYAISYEDFTTFTEVDPNSHITVVSATTVDYTSYRNEDAYLYKDYGVGHFDDFEHLIQTRVDTSQSSRFFFVWVLSDYIEDVKDLNDANRDSIRVSWYTPSNYVETLYLAERDGASSYSNSAVLDGNTVYWLTIMKNDLDLSVKVYSDSARTDLETTLSLTLQNDYNFRYLYVAQTYNSDSAYSWQGENENLDLQEGGIPLTSVTSTEVELDLSKPTSHPSTSTDIIYWGLRVPTGTPKGSYNGTATYEAKAD